MTINNGRLTVFDDAQGKYVANHGYTTRLTRTGKTVPKMVTNEAVLQRLGEFEDMYFGDYIPFDAAGNITIKKEIIK